MGNADFKTYDIAVTGGGAGGFAAAISAALLKGSLKIAVFEGGERVCRKVSASGNGRGNIANSLASALNYHGSDISAVKGVLGKVPLKRLMDFFEKIGIYTQETERGRIYPLSFQASSVTDCLRLKAKELGIEENCNFFVTDISKKGDLFTLSAKDGRKCAAKAVVAACGGTASPHLSSGTGYGLLEKFGHRQNRLMPSLVQLKTGRDNLKYLKGIKTEALVSLYSDGTKIKEAFGDVIFTDYGVSGSAVFEISGSAVRENEKKRDVEIKIDFLPQISAEALKEILSKRQESLKERTAESFLTGFILKQLSRQITEMCLINGSKKVNAITSGEINSLVNAIKGFTLAVMGSLGFENAQVTAGGIDTRDFDENLMSKFCPGLYACGEMLDIDGDCGGFNLMWAFCGGIVCGEAAALNLK